MRCNWCGHQQVATIATDTVASSVQVYAIYMLYTIYGTRAQKTQNREGDKCIKELHSLILRLLSPALSSDSLQLSERLVASSSSRLMMSLVQLSACVDNFPRHLMFATDATLALPCHTRIKRERPAERRSDQGQSHAVTCRCLFMYT